MDFSKYRPCVGIMLLNREGLVFVGRRRNKRAEHLMKGHEWQMPQGGIDDGEDPFDAARRELKEETNVSSTRLLAEAPDWYWYDLPSDSSKYAFRGRYKGQRQRWFALSFEGKDSEINIDRPGGDGHPEFDAWRWERMERLPELVVPFKRNVYEQVITIFSHLKKVA